MPNPETNFTMTVVDRSGEISRFSFTPSADFLSADPLGGTPGATAANLYSAVASLIDGVTIRRSLNTTRKISNSPYASAGQREEKWLVVFQDNVSLDLYTLELPCRKPSLQPPVNSDEVDLTAAPFSTFKAAFEAAALSPDGNAVTVLSIRLIGRNV